MKYSNILFFLMIMSSHAMAGGKHAVKGVLFEYTHVMAFTVDNMQTCIGRPTATVDTMQGCLRAYQRDRCAGLETAHTELSELFTPESVPLAALFYQLLRQDCGGFPQTDKGDD